MTATHPWFKRRAIQLLACVIITVLMVAACYRTRLNNWDELGYTGGAISWSVKSPAKAQKLTYAYAKQATTKEQFDALIAGPYGKAVYHDPTTFALQHPIYDVKPLYVALVWVGWKLGFNPIRVTDVISAVAAGCLGLIVAWILIQEAGLAGFIAYPFVLFAGKLAIVGRYSTPDALAALVVFSGLWLMRSRRSATSTVAFALLLLAVWVRVDNLLLLLSCSLVLGVLALSDTDTGLSVPKVATYAALGFVTLLVIDRIAGSYGWEVLIHQAFIKHIISRQDLTFRWSDYAVALRRGVWDLQNSVLPMAFLLAGAILWLLYFSPKASDPACRRDACLLVACLLYMAAHFIVYPLPLSRYFVGVYVFILMVGLIHLRDVASLQSEEPEEERSAFANQATIR